MLAAAGGGPAVVSHASAAHLWGLPLPARDRPAFEVTTPLERRSVLDGVRVHRSGHIVDADVRHIGPIPVTAPGRIVVDLSMRLDGPALGRLLDEALRRRITSLVAVQRCALRLRNAGPQSGEGAPSDPCTHRRGRIEGDLEAFALAALRRFRVREPTVQYRTRIKGRARSTFATSRRSARWSRSASSTTACGHASTRTRVRGNELVLAGFLPLYVTSAMNDWEIAALVAEAIGDPVPARPDRPLTYAEWARQRDQAAKRLSEPQP